MIRRSSINEDVLWRRYCANPDRVSIALESLALLPEENNSSYIYGSTRSDGDQTQDAEYQPRRTSSVGEKILEEGAILKDELVAMISLSIPVIATYVLEIVPGMITLFLVGKMDNGEHDDKNKLYLDAAALGVMFYNIVGLSTGLGLLTALDTLCASAHGANQPHKMGRYLLTAIAILTITFCITGTILCNTTNALLLFGQPASVAREAGIFTLWMLPGLPFTYGYEALRKLSQARNETAPMVSAAVVGVLVNFSVGYYLVSISNFGWLGAAIARTLGSMTMLPTLFIGMYFSDREFLSHVWSGFRLKEAITTRQIKKFLNLGIPGMAQMMFEWVAFEVIALLCGLFPGEDYAVVAIGANAIVFNISTLIFMVYLGASIAGSIRIGNAMGSGDTHRAKMAAFLVLALGTLLSIMNVSLLISFRDKLPYIFTNDEDLVKKAEELFLVVALFQLPDAINCVEQGIFRAIGKQSVAAKLNFIAYYIVGIPSAYIFGFWLEMGVEGLWLGMTLGLCFVAFASSYILYRQDWQELSHEAIKRLSIIPSIQNQV